MSFTDNQQVSAAVVTGGGRGVGRSITSRLSEFRPVIVVGRTEEDLKSVALECAGQGKVVEYVIGEVENPSTCAAVVERANAKNWSISHLVCNAGIGKTGPTAEFDIERWRHIFDVNLHGSFQFIQACLPEMLKIQYGNITIMSSFAGIVGVRYDAAYSASKHALVGLARSLKLEYSKQGIQVAALCPSFIESDMTDRTIKSVMRRRNCSEQEAQLRVIEQCPAKRILPAGEIADTIAYLDQRDLASAGQLANNGGYPIIGVTIE